MKIVVLILSAMLVATSTSAVAEMDQSVIRLAKKELAQLQRDGMRHSLTDLLEKRGLPATDHKQIIDRVVREYASCVVDGLEADHSPISQAAILVISDGHDFADGRDYFESAYSKEEIDEYAESYMRISAGCIQAVYEKNYLITQ